MEIMCVHVCFMLFRLFVNDKGGEHYVWLCYIYMCVMAMNIWYIFCGICNMTMQGTLNFMQGRTRTLDLFHIIFYNLFTAGGVSLQGGFHKHRLSSSKRERMLKPTKLKDFDNGQAFIQSYDYSTSVEDFGYFCVFLEKLLKALNTHKYLYSRLAFYV